jgi:hypothetical protein
MALPLLIAKKKNNVVCPNDYKVGWLFQDDKEAYWMIWGSSKNKEVALSCAKDVLNNNGDRDVFISNIPLSEHPTLEQINNLIKVPKEEICRI